MFLFIVRRILKAIPLLLAASFFTFFLIPAWGEIMAYLSLIRSIERRPAEEKKEGNPELVIQPCILQIELF